MSFIPRFPAAVSLVLAGCLAAGSRVPADEFRYVEPARGFVSVDQLTFAPEAVLGGLEYLPDGRLVSYDTLSGEIRVEGSSKPLASFASKPFGSFIVLAPGAESVYFGESSNGEIYRVPLDGAAPVLADRISFNFDLAFDPSGRGFVSAPGLAGGNSIRLLDGDPAVESREVVVRLPGYSGPVAVDAAGDLYYGTSDGASLEGQKVFRYRRDLVDLALAGQPLEPGDEELVFDELPGIYSMKLLSGMLLFTDLGFSAGVGAFHAAQLGETAPLETLATFHAPSGLCSPSFLAVRPGEAAFEPGSGLAGGSVAIAYSDFTTVSRVAVIRPELHFVRGRVNSDAVVDLSDAISILTYLFSGGAAPEVPEAADINGDGILDLSDAVYLLDFLFRGGPAIPAPFPEPGPAP